MCACFFCALVCFCFVCFVFWGFFLVLSCFLFYLSQNKPFTMLKRDHASRQGNDRFEGFSIDLIEYVAKELEFDYELYLVHDGKFGSQMPDGRWNGVIGELIAGVSLTIHGELKRVRIAFCYRVIHLL